MTQVYLGILIDESRTDAMTQPSQDLIKGFYAKGGETIQQAIARACVAWADNKEHAQRLYDSGSMGDFMWSSPMFANAPLAKWTEGQDINSFLPIYDNEDKFEHPGAQNISCFLPMISDTIPSLLLGKLETSLLSVLGGGLGKYYGLRHVSKKSPGPIPFVIEDDSAILAWKQGRVRRGAIADWLSANHAASKEFMNIRTPTGDANRKAENIHIGFSIDDDMMQRIEDGVEEMHLIDPHDNRVVDTINPKDHFMNMIRTRGRTGEPFMYFRGNANRALPEAQKRLGLYSYASNLCLAGETKVILADGRKPLTIKQLSRESSGTLTFKVWSGRVVNGRVVPEVKNATAKLTGRKELVTITLKNGDVIRCTKDHELLTTSGKRIEAKDSMGQALESRLYKHGSMIANPADCRVVKVDFTGSTEDIYCLTVEGNSNFYISTGNATDFDHRAVLVSNCTEITLPANDERTPVCCLSSLNAERYGKWPTTLVGDLVRALDNALEHFIRTADWVAERYENPLHRELIRLALRKVIYSAQRERSIGLGVMGFHYALQQRNMVFGSPEAREFNKELFSYVKREAVAESLRLGEERGECPDAASSSDHPHVGRRNMHLLAIAPNSNNADMLRTSASCDPEYSNIYTKETRVGIFEVRNPYLKKVLAELGKDTEEVWERIAHDEGSVKNLEFLTDHQKAVFHTAFEIPQLNVVRMAADRQPEICQAQSVNLHFKPGSDINYVYATHFFAWKWGLKSLYYYRTEPEVKIETLSQAIKRKRLKDSESEEKAKGENIVYGTKVCPNCNIVKRLLNEMGVDFKFVDLQLVGKTAAEVTGDPACRTVPQVFIDGKWIGGIKEVQQIFKEYQENRNNVIESALDNSADCANCQG